MSGTFKKKLLKFSITLKNEQLHKEVFFFILNHDSPHHLSWQQGLKFKIVSKQFSVRLLTCCSDSSHFFRLESGHLGQQSFWSTWSHWRLTLCEGAGDMPNSKTWTTSWDPLLLWMTELTKMKSEFSIIIKISLWDNAAREIL